MVWAEGGGKTDPTDIKYTEGWVAEIPTYQNFNFVLNAIDANILAYAEKDAYPWQDDIAYQSGAKVIDENKTYHCIRAHNASKTTPQKPSLDTTNSYWTYGAVFSSQDSAYDSLKPKEGVKIDRVSARATTNLWESNDLTIFNKSAIIALNVEGTTYDNLVFGNVQGKLVVKNVANKLDPDSVNLNTSWEIYHAGNKPTQADVDGTIPDAPANGKTYGRNNNNWTEVGGSYVKGRPTNYTLSSFEDVVMDNSTAMAEVNLPATPTDGVWVSVGGKVAYSTNPVYVRGGSNNIMIADDKSCELDEDYAVYIFWWSNSENMWKIRKSETEGKA